ncbi:hypothetical protein AAFF_G00091450 [Aldrovandia affinis]|uniref:Uncharacterized protein n=1 Tax=Aldrovandia affinis TaxID=143900 RepID=A0AAD7R184_9TELE|nr:hypothetical protein AAFF_G00091450 [Aldrovandia affinis]
MPDFRPPAPTPYTPPATEHEAAALPPNQASSPAPLEDPDLKRQKLMREEGQWANPANQGESGAVLVGLHGYGQVKRRYAEPGRTRQCFPRYSVPCLVSLSPACVERPARSLNIDIHNPDKQRGVQECLQCMTPGSQVCHCRRFRLSMCQGVSIDRRSFAMESIRSFSTSQQSGSPACWSSSCDQLQSLRHDPNIRDRSGYSADNGISESAPVTRLSLAKTY